MIKYLEKFTWLWASLLAAAATALVFALVGIFTPRDTYFYALFLERGPIQYVTTYFFWFTLLSLAIKQVTYVSEHNSLRAAEKAFHDFRESPMGQSALIWSDAHQIEEEVITTNLAGHETSKTVDRISHALKRLVNTQSTAELDDYFRTRSEVDYGNLDTSYAVVQYLIWLLPTLGFIGTVLGIGAGISGFAHIIQNADNFDMIKAALPGVTASLGTAFDTTFLALFFSVVVVWYSALLRKNEERLLGEIDNLCYDGVVALFREHSRDTESLIKALNDNIKELCRVMNGNRKAIEVPVEAMTGDLQQIIKMLNENLVQLTADGAMGAKVERLEKRLVQVGHAVVKLGAQFEEVNRDVRDVMTHHGDALNGKIDALIATLERVGSAVAEARPGSDGTPEPRNDAGHMPAATPPKFSEPRDDDDDDDYDDSNIGLTVPLRETDSGNDSNV